MGAARRLLLSPTVALALIFFSVFLTMEPLSGRSLGLHDFIFVIKKNKRESIFNAFTFSITS